MQKTLETSAVCEIPFPSLSKLSALMPNLQRHFFQLMSREITEDQVLITLYQKRYAAIFTFQPLVGGTAVLVTVLLTALVFRASPRVLLQWAMALQETGDQVAAADVYLVRPGLGPLVDLAAFLKGVRRGLEVYQQLRGFERGNRAPARANNRPPSTATSPTIM